MTFSIARLNRLPRKDRDRIYLSLIPQSIFERFQIDRETLKNPFGERVIQGIFPPDENIGCIEVKHRSMDKDCIFSCQVSLEAFMQSLQLDFLIINDPFSERFNIDIDERGKETIFGSLSRNVPEEIRAMESGLAPGMVRQGLRLTGEFMMCLEVFMEALELKTIIAGALFYHNAVMWERYGFIYFKGGKMMKKIQEEFQLGGMLYERLDGSTPFRKRGMERTTRGRSWAIYDGIYLDAFEEEWESPVMYRMLGRDIRVNTFPDRIW
jgi:hypothetical protein